MKQIIHDWTAISRRRSCETVEPPCPTSGSFFSSSSGPSRIIVRRRACFIFILRCCQRLRPGDIRTGAERSRGRHLCRLINVAQRAGACRRSGPCLRAASNGRLKKEAQVSRVRGKAVAHGIVDPAPVRRRCSARRLIAHQGCTSALTTWRTQFAQCAVIESR